MKILNLGCGTKTSNISGVINIDWSIYLRIKKSKLATLLAPRLLNESRLKRFESIPDNVLVHDLSRGIPFPDCSIDVVYHSHMLEHLERDAAEQFLLEAKRVLKPGGIHRIVVPDLEAIGRKYLETFAQAEAFPEKTAQHENSIVALLEQSIRKEAYSTSLQKPIRRWIENFLLGDARRRGETHQWMYDRISLSHKLKAAGYSCVYACEYKTSRIANWNEYCLDMDNTGAQYKPNSLYIEALK